MLHEHFLCVVYRYLLTLLLTICLGRRYSSAVLLHGGEGLRKEH
jgi:hypothetical protein